MIGLIIAMVFLALVDVWVEYYMSESIRVNELIIAALGLMFICL